MTTFMSQKDKETWEHISEALEDMERFTGTAYISRDTDEIDLMLLKIKKCKELVQERLKEKKGKAI